MVLSCPSASFLVEAYLVASLVPYLADPYQEGASQVGDLLGACQGGYLQHNQIMTSENHDLLIEYGKENETIKKKT